MFYETWVSEVEDQAAGVENHTAHRRTLHQVRHQEHRHPQSGRETRGHLPP